MNTKNSSKVHYSTIIDILQAMGYGKSIIGILDLHIVYMPHALKLTYYGVFSRMVLIG